MQHLQSYTLLQGGRYKIISTLGQGGFGITYLAIQSGLERKVAIKEFFMKELCDRDESTSHVSLGTEGSRETVNRFREKFLKEARSIAKLNHPNIVRIIDVFEENGTAYYVMDYIDGESLSDMVKRRGAISEAEAIGYIKKVGDALSYIHSKNVNHLDIKPGNIMKRSEDGQVLVIDFGVAKQYDATTSEGTTTTPVGISKGYSPSEQYMLGGVQSFSPQSDVYSLAATLYKLLTGETPAEAMIVQDEGLPIEKLRAKNVSTSVISAIEKAMQSRRKRTPSIEAFINDLGSNASDEETEIVNTDVVETEEENTVIIHEEKKVEGTKQKNAPTSEETSETDDIDSLIEEESHELRNSVIIALIMMFTSYIWAVSCDNPFGIDSNRSFVSYYLGSIIVIYSIIFSVSGVCLYRIYTHLNDFVDGAKKRMFIIASISLFIVFIIYEFILGNPVNFVGADNEGEVLHDSISAMLYTSGIWIFLFLFTMFTSLGIVLVEYFWKEKVINVDDKISKR